MYLTHSLENIDKDQNVVVQEYIERVRIVCPIPSLIYTGQGVQSGAIIIWQIQGLFVGFF